MSFLNYLISFLLLILIIIFPLIVALRAKAKSGKFGFIYINAVSLPVCGLLIAASAYWPTLFADFYLTLLGFDQEGFTPEARAKDVEPHLRAYAEKLYWPDNGVGWQITAMFWFALLLPYPTLVVITLRGLVYLRQVSAKS